jgi:hypothetical protein
LHIEFNTSKPIFVLFFLKIYQEIYSTIIAALCACVHFNGLGV